MGMSSGFGSSGMGSANTLSGGIGTRSLLDSKQNGPQIKDLRRPSASECAMRELAGKKSPGMTANGQAGSGKVTTYTDASSLRGRSGDIYGDCDGAQGMRRRGAGGSTGTSSFVGIGSATRPQTAYDRRTGTLKAAKDGYVNRAATSSMMPKHPESAYDPVTGTLKPPRVQSAYQIYQQQ
ncbi:MAG TPA: hypothetical protein PLD90_08165 [Rhodocyclaceae bacterium]|nr:hypothetical protein [Rhodocyclaceae bacterium]HNC80141.1 hypothetical protein [Rhodocyclaceae bacterium]HNO87475.1 hypothetical protein [Rhodocyclaceae bacterium]